MAFWVQARPESPDDLLAHNKALRFEFGSLGLLKSGRLAWLLDSPRCLHCKLPPKAEG